MEQTYFYPNFPPVDYDERHFNRYIAFIEQRKRRTLPEDIYIEKHHIIPRSLGGSDEDENLVDLSAREHYIAHMILWKAYGGPMTTAFLLMINFNKNRYIFLLTSRQYSILKEERRNSITDETRFKMSNSKKGSMRDKDYREKISGTLKRKYNNGEIIPYWLGKNHTEETKNILSEKNKGKKLSNDVLAKMSKNNKGEGNPWYGKNHTEETKEKIRNINKGKKLTEETKKKIGEGNKGKIGINKNGINKYLVKDDDKKKLQDYLDNGWEMGFTKRRKEGR